MKQLFLLLTIIAFTFSFQANAQISLTTNNDFEDGTTQAWGSGGSHPNPPANISTGGPGGAGDNYLQVQSDGGGPGGKLVFFNSSSAWTGDWTTAGVTFLNMQVNNISGNAITLRLSINGSGGQFSTTNGVVVPAGSGWTVVSIPVMSGNFTSIGGVSINSTLSSVTNLRIVNNPNPSFQGINSVNVVGFDNISASNMALPVEWLSFEGSYEAEQVVLNWMTATELNNDRFVIEHAQDTRNFQPIGTIAGSGTSFEPQAYRFVHEAPSIGQNYYRIKQIDLDGHFAYSQVVAVAVAVRTPQLSAFYPHPSPPGMLQVDYLAKSEELLQLSVWNTQGQMVHRQSLNLGQGKNTLELDTHLWNKGLYVAVFAIGPHQLVRKLLLH